MCNYIINLTKDLCSNVNISSLARRTVLFIFLIVLAMGFFSLSHCDSEEEDEETKTVITTPMTVNKILINAEQITNFSSGVQEPRSVGNYCYFSSCDLITCASIPAESDPGKMSSVFINDVFKPCCVNVKSVKLIYLNCKFPSDRVENNWLETNILIDSLSFESCSLKLINKDAFSDAIFEEVKSISIVDNRISILQRSIFQNFPKLEQLQIQDNIIEQAEFDLLSDVSPTLTVLQLDGSIRNIEVLQNITGGSTLSNVQLLSIRENSISNLTEKIFKGVPRVRSLYMDHSEVSNVPVNTFQPMASSIEQLFMNDNNIVSLPNNIFSSILLSNKQFKLNIKNNPWHCDCNLKWMQTFVQNYRTTMTDTLFCTTPEENAFLSFDKANFCEEGNFPGPNTTETEVEVPTMTTSDNGQTTEEIITNNTNNIKCNKCNSFLTDAISNLRSAEFDIFKRTSNFSLTELENGTVLAEIPDLRNNVTLIWFSNTDLNLRLNSINSSEVIHCMQDITSSVLLEGFFPGTTYTICMIDQPENLSPLNCLGLTTQPIYLDRTWLANRHKTVVLLLFIISILIFSLISAFVMFLAIRRYPHLLRGSKRILMVKRRSLDALVLPGGIEIKNITESMDCKETSESNCSTKNLKEDGYVTPLPECRRPVRKDSRISRVSSQSTGASYISGIEPTLMQLASWRLRRLKCELKSCDADPPPLPPYPCRKIVPSLSMTIDSSRDDISEDFMYVL